MANSLNSLKVDQLLKSKHGFAFTEPQRSKSSFLTLLLYTNENTFRSQQGINSTKDIKTKQIIITHL